MARREGACARRYLDFTDAIPFNYRSDFCFILPSDKRPARDVRTGARQRRDRDRAGPRDCQGEGIE